MLDETNNLLDSGLRFTIPHERILSHFVVYQTKNRPPLNLLTIDPIPPDGSGGGYRLYLRDLLPKPMPPPPPSQPQIKAVSAPIQRVSGETLTSTITPANKKQKVAHIEDISVPVPGDETPMSPVSQSPQAATKIAVGPASDSSTKSCLAVRVIASRDTSKD